MANEGMLIGVVLVLTACGPSNERPQVQGRDAAAHVDADGQPGDAPDAGAAPAERVDALSIIVSDERGAWPGRVEQSCEFRNGVPYFTAVFDSPAGNPCGRVTFVGGERGDGLMLPDGGVDRWSAGWSCGKVRSTSAFSGDVASSAPYATAGDGGSVTRVNSQVSVAIRGDVSAPPVRVTVTILGCPVRSSP